MRRFFRIDGGAPKPCCIKKGVSVSWSDAAGKYTFTCKGCGNSLTNVGFYFRDQKWIALSNLKARWNKLVASKQRG